MAQIQLTPTRETLYSRTPERAGGYIEIVERFYVDQYGREWHSFHRGIVFDDPLPENEPPGSPDLKDKK